MIEFVKYLVSVPYPEDNKSNNMRAPEDVAGPAAAGHRGHLAPENRGMRDRHGFLSMEVISINGSDTTEYEKHVMPISVDRVGEPD